MKQHLKSIPISLHKLQSSIPPEIEAIVLKSMRLNQDERYQLTSVLWNDLKHFADIDLLLFKMDKEPVSMDAHTPSNMDSKQLDFHRIFDTFIINCANCRPNAAPIKHRLLRFASDFHKLFICHL